MRPCVNCNYKVICTLKARVIFIFVMVIGMVKENNFGMYKSSEFILIRKSSKKTVAPWQCKYDTGLCVRKTPQN